MPFNLPEEITKLYFKEMNSQQSHDYLKKKDCPNKIIIRPSSIDGCAVITFANWNGEINDLLIRPSQSKKGEFDRCSSAGKKIISLETKPLDHFIQTAKLNIHTVLYDENFREGVSFYKAQEILKKACQENKPNVYIVSNRGDKDFDLGQGIGKIPADIEQFTISYTTKDKKAQLNRLTDDRVFAEFRIYVRKNKIYLAYDEAFKEEEKKRFNFIKNVMGVVYAKANKLIEQENKIKKPDLEQANKMGMLAFSPESEQKQIELKQENLSNIYSA